jgi:uncharacterized protein YecE (DUF72 family)
MNKGLYLGTSGWSYPDSPPNGWKDILYHKSSTLLQQYLTYFDTAEINSTFYAPPKPSFIKHLATNTPEGKFFTAKIPKKVTHDYRLELADEGGVVLQEFIDLMTPIKEKLEVLLIQLPPWDMSQMANLETFFSSLPTTFRYAIEFRHESWLTGMVWNLLEDYGIAHVVVDEPRLPINLRITADFSYVRWHGHGQKLWYYYRYSTEELSQWVPRLETLQSSTDTVLGYFNNHFAGNAPLNTLQMLQLLGKISPHQSSKLERMMEHFSTSQTILGDF